MTTIGRALKRSIIGLAVAASALAGVSAVTGSPAHADLGSPGCVTQTEFRMVRNGMTRPRVARIFGTDGRTAASSRYGGYRAMVRSYKGCRQFSYISVGFMADPGQPLRVNAKSGLVLMRRLSSHRDRDHRRRPGGVRRLHQGGLRHHLGPGQPMNTIHNSPQGALDPNRSLPPLIFEVRTEAITTPADEASERWGWSRSAVRSTWPPPVS